MRTVGSRLLILMAAAVLVEPMGAQSGERRANVSGGGGDDNGKCTVELRVDGRGNQELIHAEQRIRRDGFRNVELASFSADNRRNGWMFGTVRARRGNHERPDGLDIGSSMNQDNRSVRPLKGNRR